jgi:hypothetical protein
MDPVLKEILETEMTYVDNLAILVRIHTQYPIFSNLPNINTVNTKLLALLQTNTLYGLVFVQIAPFFKVYSIYARNFNSILAQIRENPNIPNHVESLALTPIQRIPRYRLLLEQLAKHCPPGHQDYLNIQTALDMVRDVATFLNDTLKSHQYAMEMIELSKSLVGYDTLITPGRFLVKKVNVTKISRKSLQNRTLLLFNDLIIFTSPGIITNSLVFHQDFPLDSVKVSDGPMDNSALIFTRSKSFRVQFDDVAAKDDFFSCFRNSVQEFEKSRKSLKKGILI